MLTPSEKPAYAPVYSFFLIWSNENSSEQFVAPCNVIVWRVSNNGKLLFYNKCLDWYCVNRWDLENISSVYNT